MDGLQGAEGDLHVQVRRALCNRHVDSQVGRLSSNVKIAATLWQTLIIADAPQ